MKLIPNFVQGLVEKATGIEDLDRAVFAQSVKAAERVSPQLAAELLARRFSRPRRWPAPQAELELAKKGTRVEFRCGLVGYRFGSGPTVLLVHGWGGRGLQLGALVDSLVKSGLCVVTLDGPAHGESPGDWTSPTHFAVFLKSVGLELGPLRAIVGHSFGGGAAILALESGLDCEKAVLVAAPNKYGPIVERYSDFVGIGAEARHIFHQLVSYKVGIPSRDFCLSSYFSRIRQPTLIIHDKNDKELSYLEAEGLAIANDKSKLVITEGLGHRRILKAEIFVEKTLEHVRT